MFGYFQAESEQTDTQNEEISVFTVSKRKIIGEAAGTNTLCINVLNISQECIFIV